LGVGGARLRSAVRRAIAALRRRCLAVWGRDRAQLGFWAALWNRFARITIWSVRGVFVHKLSLQAAALAYYTLFSIVPVLVVGLWTMKLLHLIPYLKADLPAATAATAAPGATYFPDTNVFLREAVRGILAAVDRAGEVHAGIVGLAALLYGVIKQVMHVEQAIDSVAGARGRRPRYRRMLGYLALLALPPALLIVSGLLRALSRMPLGSTFARAMSWLLAAAPLLKSAIGVVVGLSTLSTALAIFYGSAARARVARLSALFGGALGAVSLAAVLWLFARLQIGASHVGTLESGMAAVPVFLAWSFSSWLVILIGAQVAAAHELDGILVHGVRAVHLDPYDEQVVGVQMMVEATRRASSPNDAGATADDMARRLRLLPENVRDLAGRLERAGMIRRNNGHGFQLACDPDKTGLRDVVSAVIGRPAHERGEGRRSGPTLRELAEKDDASRARSAVLSSNDVALSSE